jgi:hypothetical protein
VSSLFPEGITKLADLPFQLHDAIVLALQFLSFEELPKDERPSRSIYLSNDKLKTHFEAVEKRREEQFKSDGPGEIEDPVQNQAASQLIAK